MTNEAMIRSLSTRQLAEMLIRYEERTSVEYDWDENPIEGYQEDHYITSDGEDFYFYDSALEHERWWLKQEEGETNDS